MCCVWFEVGLQLFCLFEMLLQCEVGDGYYCDVVVEFVFQVQFGYVCEVYFVDVGDYCWYCEQCGE